MADPDVAQALVVRADLLNDPLIATAMSFGSIVGIGIDLSGSTAALDVVVANTSDLDPYHTYIPASYEGMTVEQDVIEMIDTSSDTSDVDSAD